MSSAQICFSPEAHTAPFTSSAVLAVEFTLIAEKETLPCLQAFCTFLGKTHEATPCSTWSSGITSCTIRESSATKGCSLVEVQECGEKGGSRDVEGKERAPHSLPVTFELLLTPFSVPPTFCEQFINETLTVLLVKTAEPVTDGNPGVQRKEQYQSKGSSKQEAKEKTGKRGALSKPVVPQGDMRTAEVKAAPLLLLKDGETMQAPEEAQQTLASIPGIVSLRLGIKAINAPLSPELRVLLNPVWLVIKEVRNLPLVPKPSSSVQRISNESFENVPKETDENTPSKKGEIDPERIERRHYFARLSLFSKVFETQPVQEEFHSHSASSSVRWNSGFLCFWGPAVIDQNKLKDFIEEQKLEIELFNSEESLAALAESEVAWAHRTPQNSKPAHSQCPAKPHKQNGNSNAKKRTPTASPHRAEQPSVQSLSDDYNGFLTESESPKIKPPHGAAYFHLNAMSSCRATRLCFLTDVLPVAGFSLVPNEKEERATSLCRVNAPDFIKNETKMLFSIQIAEPLFQPAVITAAYNSIQNKQEEEGFLPRSCSPVPLQLFNRIFIVAPLNTPLAAQLSKLEAREKALINEKNGLHLNNADIVSAAKGKEEPHGDDDFLSGFIIDDGECLYSVLEGLAVGRLAEAARMLQATSFDDERKGWKILYNSRLRFSERRYSPMSSLEKIEINRSLAKAATSRDALNCSDTRGRLTSSGFSKLQLCTLFTRAADLKCNDLFPTAEEVNCMRMTLINP